MVSSTHRMCKCVIGRRFESHHKGDKKMISHANVNRPLTKNYCIRGGTLDIKCVKNDSSNKKLFCLSEIG